MLRRMLVPALVGTMVAATAAATKPSASGTKSPPWLSIEAPVNPFDQSVRGATMLVHTFTHGEVATSGDLTGSAEGIVSGERRSVALRFEPTRSPGVFAVRRQWATEGTWVLRVSFEQVTAIVSLDRAGNVVSARVPTTMTNGYPLPRAVGTKEIDSTLADAVKR